MIRADDPNQIGVPRPGLAKPKPLTPPMTPQVPQIPQVGLHAATSGTPTQLGGMLGKVGQATATMTGAPKPPAPVTPMAPGAPPVAGPKATATPSAPPPPPPPPATAAVAPNAGLQTGRTASPAPAPAPTPAPTPTPAPASAPTPVAGWQAWNQKIASGAVPNGAPQNPDGSLVGPQQQVEQLGIPQPDAWVGHRPIYSPATASKFPPGQLPAWGIVGDPGQGVTVDRGGQRSWSGSTPNTFTPPPAPIAPLTGAPSSIPATGGPTPGLALPGQSAGGLASAPGSAGRPAAPEVGNVGGSGVAPNGNPGIVPVGVSAPPPKPYELTAFGPGNDLLGTQISPTTTDRFQMVKDRLGAFDENQAAQAEQLRRSLTKNNAAMGRLGSGMLRTDTGNLVSDLARQRRTFGTNALADAADGTITDARATRGELRTERDFQNQMARQAVEDRIRQWLLESQDQQTQFGQGLSLAQLGLGGNAAGQLFGASGMLGQDAGDSWSAVSKLLADYMARQPKAA